MSRLSRAGFKREFVRLAILPDWWDEDCQSNPALLPEVEIRIARFLGYPLATIRDPRAPLAPPDYPGAQLRRVRDLGRDRLRPAIHSALRIGAAAVRSLRPSVPSAVLPPSEGLAWRSQILESQTSVTLDTLLSDLWGRGVLVIPLSGLPTPSFQGIACVVDGRPVVLLGHRHDEPGRVAFLVAHETGHLAAGDCTPERQVVDEEGEIGDESEMERTADRYATNVMTGADSSPIVEAEVQGYRELADLAAKLGRQSGADAGAIIFSWAARSGDYATATMAVKALYRASGARRMLREHFARNLDLDTASESDRALLRCVHGELERGEARP